jgi:hypothetical protein
MSDKQGKTTLDKAVKVSIIASALIFSLAMAYYLVVFIPQKEQNRFAEQKQEQERQAQEKQAEKDLQAKKDEYIANARRDCIQIARDKATEVLKKRGGNQDMLDKGLVNKDDYDRGYKDCLREKGIEE